MALRNRELHATNDDDVWYINILSNISMRQQDAYLAFPVLVSYIKQY